MRESLIEQTSTTPSERLHTLQDQIIAIVKAQNTNVTDNNQERAIEGEAAFLHHNILIRNMKALGGVAVRLEVWQQGLDAPKFQLNYAKNNVSVRNDQPIFARVTTYNETDAGGLDLTKTYTFKHTTPLYDTQQTTVMHTYWERTADGVPELHVDRLPNPLRDAEDNDQAVQNIIDAVHAITSQIPTVRK